MLDELLAGGRRAKDVAKALSLDSGWSARSIYERISARRDADRGAPSDEGVDR